MKLTSDLAHWGKCDVNFTTYFSNYQLKTKISILSERSRDNRENTDPYNACCHVTTEKYNGGHLCIRNIDAYIFEHVLNTT